MMQKQKLKPAIKHLRLKPLGINLDKYRVAVGKIRCRQLVQRIHLGGFAADVS